MPPICAAMPSNPYSNHAVSAKAGRVTTLPHTTSDSACTRPIFFTSRLPAAQASAAASDSSMPVIGNSPRYWPTPIKPSPAAASSIAVQWLPRTGSRQIRAAMITVKNT